jgi:hypothetical protein
MQEAPNGSEVFLYYRCRRRRLSGTRRWDEVDGGSAVVAERKADLTVVVV